MGDALAMTGNGIPHLVRLLDDDFTVQAAALALGRACERGHKGNQDAIAMTPDGASLLLDLIEHENEEVVKTVQFAVFWASANASVTTRTHWERSRGLCMSLVAPTNYM